MKTSFIQGAAMVLALVAFGATAGFAYYGAFTDSIHAWTACFVSGVLTVIFIGAAVAVGDVS